MSEPPANHPGWHDLRYQAIQTAVFAPLTTMAQRLRWLTLNMIYRRAEPCSSSKKVP
jgi:hypothetical protein